MTLSALYHKGQIENSFMKIVTVQVMDLPVPNSARERQLRGKAVGCFRWALARRACRVGMKKRRKYLRDRDLAKAWGHST